LTLLAYKPAFVLLFQKSSNCTNLVAVLPAVGFSKNTPIVAASDPKALEILEANPILSNNY
jgi:hypothetical protein